MKPTRDSIPGTSDIAEVFARLGKSAFRRRFHLNPTDRRYLEGRGLAVVLEHAAEFIQTRLAPAQPRNDGKQTPWRGHPVFVAQHATATCCRGCLEKWHRIPKGRQMTGSEMDYALRLIGRWLEREQADAGITQIAKPGSEELFD